jgi:hypothetical protein
MTDKKGGLTSAVLMGAAGTVGTGVVLWLIDWFSPVVGFFVELIRLGWRHAMAQSQWPNWSAYLLSFWAAISALRWAFRAWSSRKDNHNRFTQFNLGGVVLWSWRSISSHPAGLVPYCPACSTQLVYRYDDGSHYADQRHTELICQHCNRDRVVLREPGNYDDLIKRIKREIDRLIRTGQWRQHVPESPKK